MTTLKTISKEYNFELLNDDPVRPHIPHLFRISQNRKSFILLNDDNVTPRAVICAAFTNEVARTETDLATAGNTAMFYTVWSYNKGAGRDIIFAVVESIKQNMPEVNRFVTLSPTTEMARKFHLSNGAIELQHNGDSVNFEYKNL